LPLLQCVVTEIAHPQWE